MRPTDEEIMVALCCGAKCESDKDTGYCHRWDFTRETKCIRALLERCRQPKPIRLSRALTRDVVVSKPSGAEERS